MAYRHLLLLGESNGGTKLDHIDLGPARADATISARVLDYLRTADRLVEETLAPAALLAARFGLLPDGTDSIELDKLLSLFYQLPRLPKLAGPQVLRQSLAEGVRHGLFGLASGSAWDAEDAVLRFGELVDTSEIQFQPGTWLVRAAAIKGLIAARKPAVEPSVSGEPAEPGQTTAPVAGSGTSAPSPGASADTIKASAPPTALPGVTLHIRGIPGSQVREVIKVAVLPLSAASPDVTVEMIVRAEGGVSGIPRETLDLVVREGLRQLGLHDIDVTIPPG
jgi:hypothetical protein